MNRLAALGACCTLLSSLGCMSDGGVSVRRALGWDDPAPGRAGTRVVTPSPKNLPRPDAAVAERVDLLGRKIIAQNTFTGIEPLFHTLGVPEDVLFHSGPEQLYISEGLVKKCASDAELAAVLCSELGQMVAERRSATALGRNVDPIPDATFGAGPNVPGGAAYDAGRQASLAYHDQKFPRGARPNPVDARKTAQELLSGAGYSVAELDRVEPLLKPSERAEHMKKFMASSAPEPTWKK